MHQGCTVQAVQPCHSVCGAHILWVGVVLAQSRSHCGNSRANFIWPTLMSTRPSWFQLAPGVGGWVLLLSLRGEIALGPQWLLVRFKEPGRVQFGLKLQVRCQT
jgi:hypothetical protein